MAKIPRLSEAGSGDPSERDALDLSGARVLAQIKAAKGDATELPPLLTNMHFVRYVADGWGPCREWMWSVYVCHDPCHDMSNEFDRSTHPLNGTRRPDRNTVIALHRKKGIFRVIGRELDSSTAYSLANGDEPEPPRKLSGMRGKKRC